MHLYLKLFGLFTFFFCITKQKHLKKKKNLKYTRELRTERAENMYVTRPLSLYIRSPESLSVPPPEGSNSGYLVLSDHEESETTSCFGLCKSKSIKHLPFPQNKDLTVWYSISTGVSTVTYWDDVLFIPVLNQPLSSNRYYVIRRKGEHKGYV